MSTINVEALKHPNAASNNITMHSDGSLTFPTTSNAHGTRHVATGTLPTSGDGNDGDIWYVI